MAGSLRIDLGGLNLDQLDQIEHRAPAALAAGMEHIRGVSAEQTPVESGRLVGSATVEVDGDQASLTFEGPYARYQHERIDLHHEHGNAKFLENPIRSDGEKAIEIVAQRLKDGP